MSEPWRLSLREASDRLVTRELSAVELLDATLERLERTEGVVHAYAALCASSARARAMEADIELATGGWRGPLHGIPVGVKDMCYVEGVPTEAGSRVLQGFTPSFDATAVGMLRRAGAVILGKTV